MIDRTKIKQQFPIFNKKIRGKKLVYFDNASTTQKPVEVIDALVDFYKNTNSNIHRGIHTLSEESTLAYESVREKIAEFINARSSEEIIFTKNTTESINLVAYTWGEKNIKEGDEILVSDLEHHSNLLPWQQLCKRKKAVLKNIPLEPDYDLKDIEISRKTKLLAITGMSNVLGTMPDVKKWIKKAHIAGAKVLLDGAQSVAHSETDVQDLDCDFLAFSSHKMLGPTGVGVLFAKKELLEKMPPFLFGGDMVKVVTKKDAVWQDIPGKFEAGTPNIADVIAFGKAVDFLLKIGMKNIKKHDEELTKTIKQVFSKYEEVTCYCPERSGGIFSFTLKGIHPHDIAEIFDSEGVAIRSGNLCNQPLMELLKVSSVARVSFYLYNDVDEIKLAEKALKKTIKTFA